MKRHCSLEEKLAVIKLVEQGQSARSVSDKLHLGRHIVYEWLAAYKDKGVQGLIPKNKRKNRLSYEEKCKIVREYQESELTLYQLSVKYNVSTSQLGIWVRLAEKNGFEALIPPKLGRPKTGMVRMKRLPKEECEKENERLRKENERLRLENLLLKKVRALVEEREAQNRAIGRKPSKN
jgi:transposase